MGRHIRYWYTYRIAVAVVIAVALSGAIYWLYTQQVACDTQEGICAINLSVHPQDRLLSQSPTDQTIEIVGLDDKSVQQIGSYPITRDHYADALVNLEKAGAAVVAFDVGFPDRTNDASDDAFAKALASSKIPVILSYGGENTVVGTGQIIQTGPRTKPKGIDQIPLRKFWCADANTNPRALCQKPYSNVILASTDIRTDADGVVRRVPMLVQPACFATGACDAQAIYPLGFAAYRAFVQQGTGGAGLQESNRAVTFDTNWTRPLQVDGAGAALINFTGPADTFKNNRQYVSFGDVATGTFPPNAFTYVNAAGQRDGKIVLVGAYNLTGFHDEQLVTTSAGSDGTPMTGVEIHANLVQMLLSNGSSFLTIESPLLLFLMILLLGLATAVSVARVSVLWGLAGTVVALVLFTLGMSYLANFQGFVPDLFHPWLAIVLAYSGVTAYRFLYEDREKRKVTAIFSQYLKPEIVADLAKRRRGVEDIMRGGERRDVTLLFVDIRGFTSMSESMAANDVTEVVQMYLDHLSGIIFTWDGTIDKYVGDEIVAFWNAPRLQADHALLAVRCAYDLVNRAPELQQRLIAKGLPPIRWGIGINTGPAVVGMMGSRSRYQYTALGDTVNTAARFCAHAPAYHLLIGQQTYELCKDYIAVDLVPGVQLKGKSAETFRIYQVTAVRETPTSPWVHFPTEMATQAHHTFTTQYTQQTVIAAGEADSTDILVGEAAEQALAAGKGPSPT